MRDLQEFLSYFQDVRNHGEEYIARCPLCNKKKLYISDKGSKAVLMCQHCGKDQTPDVLAAAGLKMADLFFSDQATTPGAPVRQQVEQEKPKKQKVYQEVWQYVTQEDSRYTLQRQHRYFNENNELVSIKAIYKDPATNEKTARWFSPAAGGGFICGTNGKRIPLYNMGLLRDSDSDAVFVVEGEKDCDTLNTMGLVAVSTPNGGAQTTWLPEYSQELSQKRVFIITDNDETGRKYGETIANNLQSVAAFVATIPAESLYEGLKNKGDITDIVDIIGKEKALQALRAAVKAASPASYQPNDFSDAGNAEVFTAIYKNDLTFNPAMGWLYWTGKYWKREDRAAQDMAVKLSAHMLEDANRKFIATTMEMAQEQVNNSASGSASSNSKSILSAAKEYLKHAQGTRSAKRIKDMVELATYNFLKDPESFDADPNALNTPAGIVDLKTGKISPHKKEKYCTHCTAVAPGTQGAALWKGFLDQITTPEGGQSPDYELQNFLQKMVGMALHGKVYEEKLVMAYGAGRNGKSTFFNAVAAVLGDYSGGIDIDVLTTDKQHRGATLATLRGKRLVTAGELEEGRRLSVSTVKRICSTDKFIVEEKYKAPAEVTPSHTMFIFTNHLPRVGSTDDGTWRRLVIAPFKAVIPVSGNRPNFADTLVREAGPAILDWAIKGATMFYRNGCHLETPATVNVITDYYRHNEDWLSNFLQECCVVDDPHERIQASELYAAYRRWAEDSGEYIRRSNDFCVALENAGFKKVAPHNKRFWLKIQLSTNIPTY